MSDSPSWNGPGGQQPGDHQPGDQQPAGQPGSAPSGGGQPAGSPGSGGLPRYPSADEQTRPGQWTLPGYGQPGYGAPGSGGQPGYGPPGSGGQPGYGQPGYGQPGYGGPYGPPPGYGVPPYAAGGYGNPWGAPPPVPAPGGVPLRPLALGDILSGAFTLIRHNPVATLGIAAIVETVSAVFSTLVSWGEERAGHRLRTSITPGASPAQVDHALGSFLSSTLPYAGLSLIVTFVFISVLTGMLTSALGESLLGNKISLGQAWRRARVPAIIGVTLLVILIYIALWIPVVVVVLLLALAHAGAAAAAIGVIGVIATICIEILVYVRLSLAVPAVVLESAGPATALRRSWGLVRGSWWRIFGISLLTIVIVLLVSGVIDVPFSLIAAAVTGTGVGGAFGIGAAATAAPSLAALTIGAIGTIIATTITRPLTAGVTVLLYTDMRIRKEGLDLALIQAGQAGQPGQSGQPGMPGGPLSADPWQVGSGPGSGSGSGGGAPGPVGWQQGPGNWGPPGPGPGAGPGAPPTW